MRWRASAGISARSYARRSRWEDQPGGRGRRCSAWVRAVVAAYAASAARAGLRKIMVWYGMVWYGMVWYGMVWYGMVWYGMVWYGMVWYGMVWYGMVWYGMVWYGMAMFLQHCPGVLRSVTLIRP